MKLIPIFSFLTVSLFFLGCASNSGSEAASSEEAPAESSSSMGAKTAYEGSTGSGLLMERYKSGQIEGYRK